LPFANEQRQKIVHQVSGRDAGNFPCNIISKNQNESVKMGANAYTVVVSRGNLDDIGASVKQTGSAFNQLLLRRKEKK